jgi:hypothetical protein
VGVGRNFNLRFASDNGYPVNRPPPRRTWRQMPRPPRRCGRWRTIPTCSRSGPRCAALSASCIPSAGASQEIGSHSLLDVAERSRLSFAEVRGAAKAFEGANLLRVKDGGGCQ